MKETRLLRGAFFRSSIETRLVPLELDAANFTRVRRTRVFPSKVLTVVLRFDVIGSEPLPARVKRRLTRIKGGFIPEDGFQPPWQSTQSA
jgi:hypothetical protein